MSIFKYFADSAWRAFRRQFRAEQAEDTGKRFDLKLLADDAQEDNLRKARDGSIQPPQAPI